MRRLAKGVCLVCIYAHSLTLTEANFRNEVLESDRPVLVDFWAAWCGPCRAVGPLVEEIAEEYEGRAKVGKLNVDEHPGVAAKYGVRSIPTLLVFQNGEVVDSAIGAVPKSVLIEKLDRPTAVASS